MSFGDNMGRHRRKRRMTQARLARATGLSVGYISALEEGRAYPSVKTKALIAKALGVGIEELNKEEKH